MFQGAAFMYPTLEITFPLSPRQLLMIVHGEVGLSYLDVDDAAVIDLNRRTRGHCDKHFISRRATLNPIWLDPGKPPPDAWSNARSDIRDFLTTDRSLSPA
jgi:hypothetical protein